jgi:hypothetical protein
MPSLSVSLRLLALVSVAGLGAADAPEPKMDPAGLEFFEKNIRPILTERCYECHSKEKGVSKGGLILDSRQGMLAGGDLGAAVVPGDLKKSLIVVAVHQADPDFSMPPRKAGAKLSSTQIGLIEQPSPPLLRPQQQALQAGPRHAAEGHARHHSPCGALQRLHQREGAVVGASGQLHRPRR